MKYKSLAIMLLAITIISTGCSIIKKQPVVVKEKTTEKATEKVTEKETKRETETETESKYIYSDETIKLAKYKGIKCNVYRTADDSSVKDTVNAMLDSFATYDEIKDRAITETDTVRINVAATVDGNDYQPFDFTDFNNDMSIESFIGGFNAKLVGQKPGTKIQFSIAVPKESSNADLAGKTVDFTVDVLFINGNKHLPQYNDEFVKKNLGYNSIKEYEDSIRENNEKMYTEMENDDVKNQIKQYLMNNSIVEKIDDSILSKYKNYQLELYKNAANSEGVALEKYVADYLGMSTELFNETIEYTAKNDTIWEIIVRKIAELEDIKYSDDMWNSYLNDVATSYGYDDVAQYKKDFLSTEAEKEKSKFQYLESTVFDKLIEYANVNREEVQSNE